MKWECYRCGHIVEGEKSPDECPNCHHSLSFWLEVSEPVVASEMQDLLRKIPIFNGLGDKALADLSSAFREMGFVRGAAIVKQGEESVSFSILTTGSAEVRSMGKTIATLKPYQFFGELAALGLQRHRTADVIAGEHCSCLVAVQSDFQRVLSSHPTVASHLLGEIRTRYQQN